jgi:hypothetical protein
VTEGWFVVNVRDAAWVTNDALGADVHPGVETETTVPAEAYAPFPKWQPGPPKSWDGLPWG